MQSVKDLSEFYKWLCSVGVIDKKFRKAGYAGRSAKKFIDLGLINKTPDKKTILTFAEFWKMYEKKVGQFKAERRYKRIPESDRLRIFATLQYYVESTPDKKLRQNPFTYLNSKTWNDEIGTVVEDPAGIPIHIKKAFDKGLGSLYKSNPNYSLYLKEYKKIK